jgi:CRISPR-associated protein Csd1
MLQPLVEYAQKNLTDSEPGFTTRNVRWLADISSDGNLINVLPLGDDKGEQTSKCPDMHNMNAGGRAHFLVETVQTISLLCKPNEDPKKIAGSHEKHIFLQSLLQQSGVVAASIKPLSCFMENVAQVELLRERLAAEKAKPTDWMRWRV